tara:strand:- start:10 stop:339 length:330 start_codon:yes stop_codon:yes gene_type:complete
MHFTDNLKTISSEPLVVKASLHLLSTKQGGRKVPVTGKFRPNHNFGSRQNTEFYIGEIFFEGGDCMFPGETREVTVRFLYVEGLASRLQPGFKWRIQEGMCLIGEATVI